MDLPQPVSAELMEDLQNLRKLNRWFGSYSLTRSFLTRWLKPGSSVKILDLATGAGDIPREIVSWCRSRNIHVEIDAMDFHPSTLAIAKQSSTEFPEIRYHKIDILAFESETKWDLVICSLALHHFSDDDATLLLKRCRELSNHYVLVADLCRTVFARFGIWLVTAIIFRQEMTRHDARLSIARAFSYKELGDLAHRAGWEHFHQRKFPTSRQAIWLDQVS